MNSLTLQWHDAGEEKTQIVYEQQPSKNPGTVRIGRDPKRCDIVLSHPTVSGLHVEIFFNYQQKRFYIRILSDNNPPLVDGKQLFKGDAPLNSFPATILEPPKPGQNSHPVSPGIPPKPASTAPSHQGSYGLQCPNCHRVSSIEHLQVGCPWCGTSLAAAVSVLVSPDNNQC